jgi:hypothetical protein
MECVVKLGVREEVFLNKIKEIDNNLEAIRKNYEVSRYSQKFDKDGNLEGMVDYQDIIDYLLNLKKAIQDQLDIDLPS